MLSEIIVYIKKNIAVTALISLCVMTSIILINMSSLIAHEAELDFDMFQKAYNEGQFYQVSDRFYDETENIFIADFDQISILSQINNWFHNNDLFNYFEIRADNISVKDKDYIGEYEDTYNTKYSGMWIDRATVEHFELSVSAGRMFDEDDYIHKIGMTDEMGKKSRIEFPVIIGNGLSNHFSVGEKIELYSPFCSGTAIVVGVLKPGASVPYINGLESLDNRMIFPFYSVFSGEEAVSYLRCIYYQKNNGFIYSEYTAADLQDALNEYTSFVGVPGAYLICGAQNQWQPVFAQNLSSTLNDIRKLAIVITFFSAIILAVYLFIRIMKSARYYGILLLNGFTEFQIRIIIVCEVVLIMIASFGIATWISVLVKNAKYMEYDINLFWGLIPILVVGVFGVVSAILVLSKYEISLTIRDE